MDAERFDDLTKAMASGATRRRALRLAGGGLAGALLAAAGLSKRAGAQANPSCGDMEARCLEAVGGACADVEAEPNTSPLPCYVEKGGGACRAYVQACNLQCGLPAHDGCAGGCPNDTICVSAVNAAGRLLCRCVNLD